jgi:hypothetical protein
MDVLWAIFFGRPFFFYLLGAPSFDFPAVEKVFSTPRRGNEKVANIDTYIYTDIDIDIDIDTYRRFRL